LFTRLIAVSFVLSSFISHCQSRPDWPEDKPSATASSDCESPGDNKSSLVRSPRGFSVAVEMQANIQGLGKDKRCHTSWLLHIEKSGDSPKTIEVDGREDAPDDNEWSVDNEFDVISWSRDGTRMLGTIVIAGGDYDETSPVVYDHTKNKWWRVALEPIFRKMIAKDCLVLFRPYGFSSDGNVLVFASSSEVQYGATKECFSPSRWELDYEKKSFTRVKY